MRVVWENNKGDIATRLCRPSPARLAGRKQNTTVARARGRGDAAWKPGLRKNASSLTITKVCSGTNLNDSIHG